MSLLKQLMLCQSNLISRLFRCLISSWVGQKRPTHQTETKQQIFKLQRLTRNSTNLFKFISFLAPRRPLRKKHIRERSHPCKTLNNNTLAKKIKNVGISRRTKVKRLARARISRMFTLSQNGYGEYYVEYLDRIADSLGSSNQKNSKNFPPSSLSPLWSWL